MQVLTNAVNSVTNAANVLSNKVTEMTPDVILDILGKKQLAINASEIESSMKSGLSFMKATVGNKTTIANDQLPSHVEIDGVMTDISGFKKIKVLEGDELKAAADRLIAQHN
jgi:hypothetical protein